MRLSKEKIDCLKETIKSLIPDAKVYLFGSRIDDSKKGGDIDILITASQMIDFKVKGRIKRDFYNKFGEQKIDLVCSIKGDYNSFTDIILEEAIEL